MGVLQLHLRKRGPFYLYHFQLRTCQRTTCHSTDTPKRTITVTTTRPVTDRDIAIVIGSMEGDLIQSTMNDKKESEKNTRTWQRLGD
jgi:hypothetical protein